jgi:hypothetical protein
LEQSEAILHELKSLSVLTFSEDIQDRISPGPLYFFIITLQRNRDQISNFWNMGSDPTKKVSGREPSSFWNGRTVFCAYHDPLRKTCPQHCLPTIHTVHDLPQCGAIANRIYEH